MNHFNRSNLLLFLKDSKMTEFKKNNVLVSFTREITSTKVEGSSS